MIYKKLKKYNLGGYGFQQLNGSQIPGIPNRNIQGNGQAWSPATMPTMLDKISNINNASLVGGINSITGGIRNGINKNQTSTENFANTGANVAQGIVGAINPVAGAALGVTSALGKGIRGSGTNALSQTLGSFVDPTHSLFTAGKALKEGDINFGEAIAMQIPIIGGGMKAKLAREEQKEKEEKLRKERMYQGRQDAGQFYASNPGYEKGTRTEYFKQGGSLNKKLRGNIIGGELVPLDNDTVEAIGRDHEEGGIKLPSVGAEVEDGETITNIQGEDYVFSKELGFADRHKLISKSKGKIEIKPSTPTTRRSIQLLEGKGVRLRDEQEKVKAAINANTTDNKLPEGGWLNKLKKFGSEISDDFSDVGDAIVRKGQELVADEYEGTFNTAFEKAKRNGDEVFKWNGKAYNTKSNLSKQDQLSRYGITDEQREGNGLLSDRLYNTIKPSTYTNSSEVQSKIQDFVKGTNRFTNKQEAEGVDSWGGINGNLGYDDAGSEDGWAMYLGKPQKNNTFGISQYKPSNSKDPNATYYKMSDTFEKDLVDSRNYYDTEQYSESLMGDKARVLGNFQVQEGKDEQGNYISYYDKYDLDPNVPGIGSLPAEKIAGKPFEVYGRVYYDTDDKGNKVMRKLAKGGKIGDSLNKAIPYASNIYNLLRKLPEVPRPQLETMVTPRTVNLDASRLEAKRQTRGLMRSIAEGTSNQAASNSNRAAALVGNINAVNSINQAEENTNADILNKNNFLNSTIRARNNSLMNRMRDDQVERQIAGQELMSENIANAGNKYQLQQRDKKLFGLENRRLSAILKAYEKSGVIDRNLLQEILNERKALKG